MLTLPTVNAQPDLPAVVRDVHDAAVPQELVWISCYARDSVHAKVNVVLDERNRDQINFVSDGNVELARIHDTAYSVSCTSLGIPPTTIFTPVQQYSDPDTSNPRHPQRIAAFDVSPDSTQYAVGHLDGSVYIYPGLANPNLKKRAKPHLSAVSSLRFFPSSHVLLTAGIDFTLTILPADLPTETPTAPRITPARTLRSHTRAITGTGIIPPGKNILSASLDSTVKLWDVPSGSTTSTFVARSPIQSMTINGNDNDNVILCGLQSGQFELFDIRTGSSVFRSTSTEAGTHGALSAISHSGNVFATGSTKGVASLYDGRFLSPSSSSLVTFRRNEAGIEDLCFMNLDNDELGLAVAASDGLPFVAGFSSEGSQVKVAAELAGVDCDAVRGVRTRGRDIWCASDDAVVRKWTM